MKLRDALPLAALLISTPALATPKPTAQAAIADRFLATYNSLYQSLSRASQDAAWRASTDVTDAHEGERTGANTTFAAFAGDKSIIETAQSLLQKPTGLSPLVIRELGKILLAAAEGPGTNPELTSDRVAAESRQAAAQDGYTYKLDGKSVSANDIDHILQTSRDLTQRRRAWEASKEIGLPLKAGLAKLQTLRNGVARQMHHSGYFALEVADFDMTDAEMMALLDQFVAETKPLYLKLHAWARMTLAARYHQPVPKLIPAHWINNRWSQEWSGIVDDAVNLDPLFAKKSAEWIVKTAEQFYVSMGFPSLPPTFWQKSDLYPVAAGGARHKNAHASCWHVDLDHDVRSLMSVEPNAEWFFTAHHGNRPRLLLFVLRHSRGAADFAAGCQSRHARGHRRSGGHRGVAADLLASGRHLAADHEDRPDGAAVERGARLGDSVHGLVGGDDFALRARPVRKRSAGGRVAKALVAIRGRLSGHRAAVATAGNRLRRVQQDAHQRHAGRIL